MIRWCLSLGEKKVKMEHWVQCSAVTAYQRDCKILLAKLYGLRKVDIQQSNILRLVNCHLSYCQDLGRISIGRIFWANTLFPQKTKEAHQDAAPYSQVLRIINVNIAIHCHKMFR